MYTEMIKEFFYIIVSFISEDKDNENSKTKVSDMMSKAWKNTLESLYLRLNPGLLHEVWIEFKYFFGFLCRIIPIKNFDPIGVTHFKSRQIKYVHREFFAKININEQLFSTLTEQCKNLKDNSPSPFKNRTDEELENLLISLLSSDNIEEEIDSFINPSLSNKAELFSFLQEHKQEFLEAFKSHFFNIANIDSVTIKMWKTNWQKLKQQGEKLKQHDEKLEQHDKKLAQQGEQIAQQGEQIAQIKEQQEQLQEQQEQQGEQIAQIKEQLKKQDEQRKKDKKNDKKQYYYKMIVKVRDEQNRGKAGNEFAFCYSQLGEFILMKNSYVTLNATNSCPASTKKLREQYADYIAEDGLLLKNIHFNSISAVASFVNYSSENGNDCFKGTKKLRKKFVTNSDGELEYDLYNKQSKKIRNC